MAPVYSREQLAQFLDLIDIPAEFRLERHPRRDLAFLTALHVHTTTTVPFENLALHYAKDKEVDIDPQYLFDKIVSARRGRGGYCLENNTLLLHVLQGLGFEVYPVAGKVRDPEKGGYLGWCHMLNIVSLANHSRYLFDVGFGGDGPTQPLPLVEGEIVRSLGTQEVRLIRDFIPGQTALTPGQRYWIYQGRNGKGESWNSLYCFNDGREWLPEDLGVINYHTSHIHDGLMTNTILAVKFLRKGGGPATLGVDEVYGKNILVDGSVKQNLGGKTEVVQECRSEEERVEALKKWFGVDVTEDERAGIGGHVSEIKS